MKFLVSQALHPREAPNNSPSEAEELTGYQQAFVISYNSAGTMGI